MGYAGRKPRLVSCGGRQEVYERFCIEHAFRKACYVAMWIDSEEPVLQLEAAWNHLARVTTVGQWQRPDATTDDQVLFMATCMETWIVADRETLATHYGNQLQQTALPPLENLEGRSREDVQRQLARATRQCTNAYEKGKRSFTILGILNPATLQQRLDHFARVRRILNARL
ncbi:MAG TPA: DUF4276 family protein [Verrucomicrobiae bacterium]|jgi:hypothetical protein